MFLELLRWWATFSPPQTALIWAIRGPFLHRRVYATVVSQRKVRSDSTADLMVEFHKRLQARSTEPQRNWVAVALREAALKIKKDSRYRHSFHWSGFVAD